MRSHAWAIEGAIGDPLGGFDGVRRVFQDPVSAIATVGSTLIGAKAAGDAADTQSDAARNASATELAMFNQNRADYTPWREAGVGALGQLVRGLGIELPGAASGPAETYDQVRARLAPGFTNAKFGGNGVDDAGLDAAARREFDSQALRRTVPSSGGSGVGLGDLVRPFSMSDYEEDPGYQFRRDEGLRGLEGSAAGRGGLLSGATLKALNKYNSDLASQEYGNAYNRYNADIDRRFNRLSSLAGIGQTATRDVASMGSQTAQNVAQNQIGAGNARASGYVGQANAITGAINNGVTSYQLNKLLTPQQTSTSWGTPGLNNFFYGSGGSGD